MTAPILVAGIGNVFLGDDGFGPEVARSLAGGDVDLPEDVRVVDYGIRGMHLAYDLLNGCRALILIDAVPGDGEPGEVVVMRVGSEDVRTRGLDAHGMDPESVLASLSALGGAVPPTFVVGCRPLDLDERIGLSAPVAAAVPTAVAAVRRVLDEHVFAVTTGTGG